MTSLKQPLHVFIVVNPMVCLVAYEFIAQRKLNPKNILIVFTRGQTFYILDCFPSVLIRKSLLNKLGDRFPTLLPTFGKSVRNHIDSLGREFVMYTSWLDSVASNVVCSTLCIGHSYLEEGDQAYKNFPLFPSKITYDRKPKTQLNKHTYKDYWRDDAGEWIGITEKSFGVAPAEKRIILRGFENVKKTYSPLLKSGDCVLLMPTPGRLPRAHWEKALLRLNIYPDKKAYLKLHPAFYEIKNIAPLFLNILKDPQFQNIEICHSQVILEAEMLFNQLVLVGDRSSVIRYASHFGSTFIKVPFLYGTPYGEMD
jgi:hypothetical protein